MYVLRVEFVAKTNLCEGELIDCLIAYRAMQAFPEDVVSLEVYEIETVNVVCRWASPHWAE